MEARCDENAYRTSFRGNDRDDCYRQPYRPDDNDTAELECSGTLERSDNVTVIIGIMILAVIGALAIWSILDDLGSIP